MLLTKLAIPALFVLVSVAPQDQPKPKFAAADLAKISWLAGTWELTDEKGGKTVEHWLPLAGTTYMGISHLYDAKATTFFEFLRVTFKNGTIAYVAQPGGSQPTAFLAVEIDDKKAVFENSKHDSPQRIRYERTEKGLTASISQMDGSKAQSFVFTAAAK